MEHERVADLLRRSADAVGPTQRERERMRLRVLAEFKNVDFDSPPSPGGPVRNLAGRSTAPGRLMVALAAALCLILSLGAMSLLLSRDALPGDPLYAIKRTAESASFGLAFDDAAKARKHLEFATARIDEMDGMVARGNTPVGSYLTALTDFDADAAAGSRLLTVLSTNGDGSGLTYLRDWAKSQSQRLKTLRPSLPERTDTSADLLTAITDRANALIARLNCYAITTGATDDVGALPATGPCATRPPVEQSFGNAPTPTLRPGVSAPGGGGPNGGGTVTPTTGTPTVTFTTPTVAPPVTTGSKGSSPTTTSDRPAGLTVPLPVPLGSLPPLLPGLPSIVLGG
ncbi:DUF5667 domain-containing protein [Kutzneria sp. CA-103260]|uniref:DUF5667 domain-containing protein n=1 Tax=Kutzneria sp. CA-103260 TaxID=2802641 RepID=UPI001BAC722D|nr:DUF5667 domain-containing protein [Kutzneria sp. CA-103260]QUQ70477.1 hypothetical protein JJ691_82560 [Kutzneria sp. CA-103260]